MSSYLLTCTPAHGHVMPLLQVARHLIGNGHDVRFLTSRRYAERVTGAGVPFLPLPADADVDLDDPDRAFPERAGLTGPAAIRFDMSNLFVRPSAAQLAAVRTALADRRTDAVLTEPLFLGAALLNRLPRAERPPLVALGIFPLGVKSRDTAPFGLGLPPMPGALGRLRNRVLSAVAERAIFGGVQREADELSRREVGVPLGGFVLDWPSRADAVVQLTVPAFEYPRSDLPATVHFAGPLPAQPSTAALPEWWSDLDGRRPVVHVTQGTVANADFAQLVLPTIEGLAASDRLVVVSTGGRPRTALPADLPANVRIAEYLPYDRLLPLVDVVVTNGGYGGVQQALAHGVPLVVAGQTEDKAEVSARVAWSGAGVDLKTNRPNAAQVARAVERVSADGRFRARAEALAAEFAAAPGLGVLDRVLADVAEVGARRG
ncbi:glycosyltransferase [Microbacterium sp. M3]|uniref:Glycosyltransferase n=1 Tax=Microbacterium arthrosphaerae TaxID=792652 RepID=A0ABU4H6G7_9MICO|nr:MULTISPECIES: glycosyltransferase [Microbacterium]MDW4574250.1 glycosyltransferase [Microbacterium arthrosphaerae]MDW7608105.1 glycosyltransferase [Microbacterium sp. M3]